MMLATMTRTPELAMEKGESDMLSQGVVNVMRHYPNAVISPKTVDIVNLGMVMATIYGTRTIAIRERLKHDRRAARAKPVNDAPQPARPASDPMQSNGGGDFATFTGFDQFGNPLN